MAKLTCNTISSRYASVDALNTNFDLIETAMENTLSRDGTSPNSMSTVIDMNSNKITNLALATNATDAASKQYVDNTLSSGQDAGASAIAAAASAAAALVSELAAASSESTASTAATTATTQAGISTTNASQTTIDAAATAADVILTHADVVLTHADVVLTHADVITAEAARVAAEAAALAAAGFGGGDYGFVFDAVGTTTDYGSL
jgi:hypothetical protein